MWFKEVFIPHAKARMVDPKKPIVLIMDGHGSHETLKMEKVAYEALENEGIEIIIFCFPSKCTHKMQPLDVVIFNPVQKRWQRITDNCVQERVTIDRYNVIPLYVNGTREVMTKELVQKAFEKTGLYPVNCNVFTDEDFAPSQASSTVAHVPPSYPLDFPSSDPAEPDLDYEPSWPGSDDKSDSDSSSSSSGSESDDLIGNDSSDDDSDNDLNSDDNAESTLTDTLQAPDTSELDDHTDGSGLMTTLGRIEERVGLLTRSMVTDAEVGLKAPQVVSLYEDKQLTQEELLAELRQVRQELSATYNAYTRVTAALSGAEAHCTIIRREVDNLRADLDKATKPRTRGMTKTKARFVTSKALYASFDDREAAQAERERITAEKAKQKAADLAAERARIAEDAVSRIFTGRVRSYKKGDLQALARALHVSEDGTVDILKDRIEEHLTGPEKVQLESNPRFSGLYPKPTQPRRRQAHTSHDESLPGVSNNPPMNDEAQLALLNQRPSSHPPPQNHHHTPSHSPPLPAPQHPFAQPLPPFNPYAHFPPYQMSYNHPYHYPPAHVYNAGSHSATPITNTQDHHLYNLNSQ